MKRAIRFAVIVLAAGQLGCSSGLPEEPRGMRVIINGQVTDPAGARIDHEAPLAKRDPFVMENHGISRTDDYYWLREREDPEVIAYLEAENEYLERQMAHTEDLQEEIFQEIVSRIPQDDESVPTRKKGYWYYTRYEEGKEYPIYVRHAGRLDAPEEIILDVNELAPADGFYSVRGVSVSPGNDIVAYGVDDVGRRFYDIRFRNLETGEWLDDVIPATTGNFAWAEDNRTVLYTKQDPETLLWDRIYRHELGSDPADDALVYREPDETFFTYVYKTKSDEYLVIGSSQTLSDEYRIIPADEPDATPRLFTPRERGLEHSIGHYGDHFYIRTNLDAENFRIMKTPVHATDKSNWVDVVPHREGVLITDFELFEEFMMLSERSNASISIRVIPWEGDWGHYVEFDEEVYDAWIIETPDFDTTKVRLGYSSMTTPTTTWEYDARTRDRELLKQVEVGGGFTSDNYRTERVWATARDGAKIPVSLLYHRNFRPNGSAPLLLYGYGSYGSSSDPSFGSSKFSLVDRGFVWAIAHVRGGQEMGRQWYEDGKLFNKKNTFTDFIDVAEHLIGEGYADPDNVFAYGGSAGGLLMGAVVNMRPDLWKGVVAAVPFVDVITTMLDESIPLTTSEYDEWGNPNDPEAFEYILSYSPYDNVVETEYPAILVTTGLHDSQVQYWEPAKWVAKLRTHNRGDDPILLHTNMEAGHGGTTGRFRRHKQTALVYAFLVDQAGR